MADAEHIRATQNQTQVRHIQKHQEARQHTARCFFVKAEKSIPYRGIEKGYDLAMRPIDSTTQLEPGRAYLLKSDAGEHVLGVRAMHGWESNYQITGASKSIDCTRNTFTPVATLIGVIEP